ncbi:alpha/beta fold hydrolase [Caballeronia hypogeia]|uniref:alpha/beta fold hydrolase n=1 Tax=Caballeronia hypogeia TaxID=1777140 RepID=UPI0012FD5224|nr:alpha/beta fold hydrolase [Caballeronia hypogeia]
MAAKRNRKPSPRTHRLNAERDVIFVDQRGTHRADPLMPCVGWEQFLFDAVSIPFAADSSTLADTAAIRECHARLSATGVDLAAYNSTENAADIADPRVATGIDNWNVYGVSYGSRLALTVLRDHPQGIRSVVLDSVSPPTSTSSRCGGRRPRAHSRRSSPRVRLRPPAPTLIRTWNRTSLPR